MQSTRTLLLTLLLLAAAHGLIAQTYPLSENRWDNPEFVDRFLGSYGVDTEKAPSISNEEAVVFREAARVGSNPKAAIEVLRKGTTAESSGAMDFALANFLFQAGEVDAAIRSFENAIRKFPNFGRAYKNIGLALVQKGDYAKALPNLVKALEILGGDGGLLGLIGYCHLNDNRPGPALDAYRLALVYQPEVRDWRLGQLKALQNLRDYESVEGIIYRYIQENPDEPEFWLQQANAFIAQRKYDKAAANYEVVRMLGGNDPEMLVRLGDLYVNLDSPTLAVEPYQTAFRSGKVPAGNSLEIAKAVSRRLSPQEFGDFLRSIETIYGDSLPAREELLLLTLRAGNAMALGKDDEAMGLLSKVVARDPLNGRALLTLGSYYYGKGELEKALNYYERAEKVDEAKLDALLGASRVLVKQEEYLQAIRRLRSAQVLDDRPFIAEYINTLQRFVN